MNAILQFLGSDSILAAIAVAGLLGGAVAVVRLALRDLYGSRWWRVHQHWDA